MLDDGYERFVVDMYMWLESSWRASQGLKMKIKKGQRMGGGGQWYTGGGEKS